MPWHTPRVVTKGVKNAFKKMGNVVYPYYVTQFFRPNVPLACI